MTGSTADRSFQALVTPGDEEMYETYGFASAAEARGFLILSGRLGLRPDRTVPPTLEEEFTLAFEGIRETLALADLDFGDVVELQTFHVGFAETLDTFVATKERYIAEPFPAWTAIGVSELAVPGAHVEVKVTAVRR